MCGDGWCVCGDGVVCVRWWCVCAVMGWCVCVR